MCRICNYKNYSLQLEYQGVINPSSNSFINITSIDCFYCINLITIPNILVNLIKLDCTFCKNLINIPSTLINLQNLNCVVIVKILQIFLIHLLILLNFIVMVA